MKKCKLIAGIALIAQSFLCFIVALIYWKKSKSLAKTFAVLSSAGGLSGAAVLLSALRDRSVTKRLEKELWTDDEDFDESLADESSFDSDDLQCGFVNE